MIRELRALKAPQKDTLVGVLQPDQGMHLPDFRAAERTFQLLEQVAGRAGRGDRPGRVIVQTYTPSHPAITSVQTHDYVGFVRRELEYRRESDYPPFSRMIVLRLDARDPDRVAQILERGPGVERVGGEGGPEVGNRVHEPPCPRGRNQMPPAPVRGPGGVVERRQPGRKCPER